MVYLGYVLGLAAVASANPLVKRASTTTYSEGDVLSVLSDTAQISTPSAYCSTLLKLKPATVTATTTKTEAAVIYFTSTTTLSTKVVTVPTYTVTEVQTPMSTNSDVTLTVTSYVSGGARLARRAVPTALSSFPASLVSQACSDFITSTSTVTKYAQTKSTLTASSTKVKTLRVFTTSSGITSTTVTVTTATQINYNTPTVTATVQLDAGQPIPTSYPGNDLFQYAGCQQDAIGNGARALEFSMGSGFTPEICLNSMCNGYRYAGLEYGGECYCGNEILNGNIAEDSGDCSMLCDADNTQLCGNGYRLTLYHSNAVIPPNPYIPARPWVYKGCYAEPATGRALKYEFPDDNLTVESCLSTCQSNGYTRAGVEYGRECWCDTTLAPGTKKQSSDSVCGFHCAGNATESCGGSRLFNYYNFAN